MPKIDLNFGDVGRVPPEGTYRLCIEKAEVKLNKAKDGHYLNIRFNCIDMPNEEDENHTIFGIVSLKQSAAWKSKEFFAAATDDDLDQDVYSIETNDDGEVEDLEGAVLMASCVHNEYNGKISLKPDTYYKDDGNIEPAVASSEFDGEEELVL